LREAERKVLSKDGGRRAAKGKRHDVALTGQRADGLRRD
jgi:hypothetical protein